MRHQHTINILQCFYVSFGGNICSRLAPFKNDLVTHVMVNGKCNLNTNKKTCRNENLVFITLQLICRIRSLYFDLIKYLPNGKHVLSVGVIENIFRYRANFKCNTIFNCR